MIRETWCIISENSFDETDHFNDALRIARTLVLEGQTGEPICIEHRGRVIRQMVLLPGGNIAEQEIE